MRFLAWWLLVLVGQQARFPDHVGYTVRWLEAMGSAMGKERITQLRKCRHTIRWV